MKRVINIFQLTLNIFNATGEKGESWFAISVSYAVGNRRLGADLSDRAVS